MGLDQWLGVARPAFRIAALIVAADTVVSDVLLLRVECLCRETSRRIDIDDARLQHRRLGMRRRALRESAERVGGVLDALLLDVELAQLLVDAEFVLAPHRRVDVRRDRRRPLQVGERDARHTERVLDQLAIGTRQSRQLFEIALVAPAGKLQVQHAEERLQRFLEPALLELRPAVHVERALVVRRTLVAAHRHEVRRLRSRILAQREHHFAAAELRLVAIACRRIQQHQLVERFQRRLEFTAQFVGACQLIEHPVVARVVGIGLQEVLILRNGRLVVGGGRGAAGGAGVDHVHFQIAEPTQRLLALRFARRSGEEVAIGARRVFLAGLDAGVRLDGVLARCERFQRRRLGWRPPERTRARREQRDGDADEGEATAGARPSSLAVLARS